jgi:hypothetical protein
MRKPGRPREDNWTFRAGLWIVQWTIIILFSVALFYVLKFMLPDSQEITKRLNDCLESNIPQGKYFPDDDGRSAEILLNQCPSEVHKWTERCELDSKEDDRTTCAVKVIVLAQTAIKKFNK